MTKWVISEWEIRPGIWLCSTAFTLPNFRLEDYKFAVRIGDSKPRVEPGISHKSNLLGNEISIYC